MPSSKANPRAFQPGRGRADTLAAADVAALGAQLRAAGFTGQDLAAFLKAGKTRGDLRDALIARLRHAPKG